MHRVLYANSVKKKTEDLIEKKEYKLKKVKPFCGALLVIHTYTQQALYV